MVRSALLGEALLASPQRTSAGPTPKAAAANTLLKARAARKCREQCVSVRNSNLRITMLHPYSESKIRVSERGSLTSPAACSITWLLVAEMPQYIAH
jgi:hypothetical protein